MSRPRAETVIRGVGSECPTSQIIYGINAGERDAVDQTENRATRCRHDEEGRSRKASMGTHAKNISKKVQIKP